MNALQHRSFPISTYNSRQSVSHLAQIFGIIETGLNCGERGNAWLLNDCQRCNEVFHDIRGMLQPA
jgi:hypothetical protein